MSTPFDRALHFLSAFQEWWTDRSLADKFGVGFAGAVFGAGWWLFIDNVAVSDKTPFLHSLPGIIATIAMLMIASVRRDELADISFGDGAYGRARLWLFISYIVSIASIVGAVLIFLTASAAWSGLSVLLQVALILGSALLLFVSRTGDNDSGYSMF